MARGERVKVSFGEAPGGRTTVSVTVSLLPAGSKDASMEWVKTAARVVWEKQSVNQRTRAVIRFIINLYP